MKIYYVTNARMPTPKAHGIQIAKACEALVKGGYEVVLVMPHSRVWSKASTGEYYQLRVQVPTVVLRSIDFYGNGKLGYLLSTFSFAIVAAMYLLGQKLRGNGGVVYARPDPFFLPLMLLFGANCFVEVHDAYIPGFLMRMMLKRARGIVATNTVIADAIAENCHVSRQRMLIEPNGVDLELFENAPGYEAARSALGLSPSAKIALYMGRFYDWKGLEILPAAAALAPALEWHVVGGSQEKFEKITGIHSLPSNLLIHEGCPPQEVPAWLAAADALLMLGTKKNETSYRYTTPIKTYEYMAAGRPMVAAATLALRDVVSEDLTLFYAPDDAAELAARVTDAVQGTDAVKEMTMWAKDAARAHSWRARARRIVDFIERLG